MHGNVLVSVSRPQALVLLCVVILITCTNVLYFHDAFEAKSALLLSDDGAPAISQDQQGSDMQKLASEDSDVGDSLRAMKLPANNFDTTKPTPIRPGGALSTSPPSAAILPTDSPQTPTQPPHFAPFLGMTVDTNFSLCVDHCLARNERPSDVAPDDPCSGGDQFWCAKHFSPANVAEACRLMCINQYPSDCSQAKYLIITSDWPNGYGSDNHIRIFMFTFAIMQNRIFVHSPQAQSRWTFDEDEYPLCRRRDPWCYYMPLTNCPLPEDWAKQSSGFHMGSNARFTTIPASEGIGQYRETLSPENSQVKGLPVQWWKAQMAQFLFRPNRYMLEKHILPATQQVFGLTERLMPKKFLCIFIRHGDKGLESAVHPVESYWNVATTVIKKFNLSDIYVASDSALAVDKVVELVANYNKASVKSSTEANLRVYFIQYPRLAKGISGDFIAQNLWNKAGCVVSFSS